MRNDLVAIACLLVFMATLWPHLDPSPSPRIEMVGPGANRTITLPASPNNATGIVSIQSGAYAEGQLLLLGNDWLEYHQGHWRPYTGPRPKWQPHP